MILANLPELVQVAFDAHQNHPVTPDKAFRRHDGQTPYTIHPLWVASMVMLESALPVELREKLFRVSLFHDVLEDTNFDPSQLLTKEEIRLVEELTFGEGSLEEKEKIWDCSPEARLVKVYDKCCNLLDGQLWMEQRGPGYREGYEELALKLADDVEKHWGPLNICRVVRAICGRETA